MEHLLLMVVITALFGAALNANGVRWGFLIWAVTDAIWCIVDLNKAIYSQAIQQAIYVGIDLYGFFGWGKMVCKLKNWFMSQVGTEQKQKKESERTFPLPYNVQKKF